MMKVDDISYIYEKGTNNECRVLDHVSFSIQQGDYIGIVGVSGSGKTTLMKHLNGLLKATEGNIYYGDQNIYDKKYPLSILRKEVGLVFQYPEKQLFCKSVLEDVCFGPLNMGSAKEDAVNAAKDCLQLVGISEEYYHVSPLELSGGQKRAVAIAGILAMNPKILILDEPAAGLDPETKEKIFTLISRIKKERNISVVLVSHHMEDVARYTNRVLVLHDGKILFEGSPREIFTQVERLQGIGIGVPQVTMIAQNLKESGFPMHEMPVTVEEAEEKIWNVFQCEGGDHQC